MGVVTRLLVPDMMATNWIILMAYSSCVVDLLEWDTTYAARVGGPSGR